MRPDQTPTPEEVEARIAEVAALNRLCDSLALAGSSLRRPSEGIENRGPNRPEATSEEPTAQTRPADPADPAVPAQKKVGETEHS